MRVNLPGWGAQDQRKIEGYLRKQPGVQSVQANPLTGNILIAFDQKTTNKSAIFAAFHGLRPQPAQLWAASQEEAVAIEEEPEPAPVGKIKKPHVVREKHGHMHRARIAVKGLDRNPHLARHVVEQLESHAGVKAHANPLTGRILVEFSEHELDLEDLITDIVDMELPDLPEDDDPKHPLDPAPLFQSATRTIGATLGLSVYAVRRALGMQGAAIQSATFSNTTAVISILTGFPFVRSSLRRLLGKDAGDLVMTAPALVSLTLSNNPLGLLVAGAEALRLLTEVVERRAAWKRYEERMSTSIAAAQPGAVIRLEPGERTPLAGTVIEGLGTATGRDGLPLALEPGSAVHAGAQVHGGPFVVELEVPHPFTPSERPETVGKSFYQRYIAGIGPASLGFAAATALFTRSWSRTLEALLLVNPRTAVIGKESADIGAAARVLSAGVTVVGTRPHRPIQLPDLLLFDGPRLLTDRFELTSTLPLSEAHEPGEILNRAATVAAAAGSPWGRAFPTVAHLPASDGHFSGKIARARIGGVMYTLGQAHEHDDIPAAARLRHRGDYLLVLRSEQEDEPLGILALRPRLAPGVKELVAVCKKHGVDIRMLSIGSSPLAAQAIANRTGVLILPAEDTMEAIRSKQGEGGHVAFVSDSAHAAEAFSACDLAIGLSEGRAHVPARADLIVNDLNGITAIIEAGAQHDKAVRDSTIVSMFSNVLGVYLGTQGARGLENASLAVYGTALAAIGIGWARLRGGERPRSLLAGLVDPHPERWGRRSIPATLSALNTSETGLTTTQASERRQISSPFANQSSLMRAILDQLRSPLTVILGFGAAVSLTLGAVADMGIIGATIAANVGIGAWQEHKAGQVAQTLERMGTTTVQVLRDGQTVALSSTEIVPGDMLLLTSGERIAADARVIESQNLEVDEAALTGESLPVRKSPEATSVGNRVVLAGSDVTTGSGRAIAVAVGRNTRMGATAAALSLETTKESPLGQRLSRLLRQTLPLALAGGAIVAGAGFLRTGTILPQLGVGGSIALDAVPEGLPLLASEDTVPGRKSRKRMAAEPRAEIVDQ
jgi:cation transport ATPase